MLSSQNIQSTIAYITGDPAADDVLPVFIAPKDITVVSASAVTTNAVAGSGTNYFTLGLLNVGAAGTGTVAVAPTTVGGTAGWSALIPKAFTVGTANNQLAAGDVLALDYDEEGTGTFVSMAVQIDYVMGQGA